MAGELGVGKELKGIINQINIFLNIFLNIPIRAVVPALPLQMKSLKAQVHDHVAGFGARRERTKSKDYGAAVRHQHDKHIVKPIRIVPIAVAVCAIFCFLISYQTERKAIATPQVRLKIEKRSEMCAHMYAHTYTHTYYTYRHRVPTNCLILSVCQICQRARRSCATARHGKGRRTTVRLNRAP